MLDVIGFGDGWVVEGSSNIEGYATLRTMGGWKLLKHRECLDRGD